MLGQTRASAAHGILLTDQIVNKTKIQNPIQSAKIVIGRDERLQGRQERHLLLKKPHMSFKPLRLRSG